MKRLIIVLGLALPLASCFHVNNRTPYDKGSNLTHLLNFYENECLKPASHKEYPYDPDRAEICKIVKTKIASYNVDSITGNASNSNVNMEATKGSPSLKPNADVASSKPIDSNASTTANSNNGNVQPMLEEGSNPSTPKPVVSSGASNESAISPSTTSKSTTKGNTNAKPTTTKQK